MAMFANNIIQNADPIARALERRRGGQPTPIMNQQSASAPGVQPPQQQNVPPETSSPYQDVLATMARRAGNSRGGQASSSMGGMGTPAAPKSEQELIIRALMERLKVLSRLEEQSNPSPMPSV